MNCFSFPVSLYLVGIPVGEFGVGVFCGRSERISGFLTKFDTSGCIEGSHDSISDGSLIPDISSGVGYSERVIGRWVGVGYLIGYIECFGYIGKIGYTGRITSGTRVTRKRGKCYGSEYYEDGYYYYEFYEGETVEFLLGGRGFYLVWEHGEEV